MVDGLNLSILYIQFCLCYRYIEWDFFIIIKGDFIQNTKHLKGNFNSRKITHPIDYFFYYILLRKVRKLIAFPIDLILLKTHKNQKGVYKIINFETYCNNMVDK